MPKIVDRDAQRELFAQAAMRLIARDGFSVSEANARIESQLPLARKIAHADFVVTNNGDLDSTRRQVEEVHKQLVTRFSAERAE